MQTNDTFSNDLLKNEFTRIAEESDKLILKISYFSLALILIFGIFYNNFALSAFLGIIHLFVFLLSKRFIAHRNYKTYILGILLGLWIPLFLPVSNGIFIINYLYFSYYVFLIVYQNKKFLVIGPIMAIIYNVLIFIGLLFNTTKEFTTENFRNQGIYSLEDLIWGIILNVVLGMVSYFLAKILSEKTQANLQYNLQQAEQIKVFERYKNFASEVENNNLEIDTTISEEDFIGKSLNNIKSKLFDAIKKEEKEKFLNEYHSKGITKISEILRMQNKEFNELAYLIVSELVQYVNGAQGALFIAEEDGDGSKYIELKAAYAYERRKFIEKKILPGEGVVGTAFIENESVYLTKLPENYLNLKSGLGSTIPRALIAQTISYNQEIVGVLEIASLSEFADYELQFIANISEYIASTIISEKSKQRTATLLEKSRLLTEQMRAKEMEQTERLNIANLQISDLKLEIENLKRMYRKV